MPKVFLGLGTNIDRERSMRAGLSALKNLDARIIVSSVYECEAVGFEGAPFYNCVAQIHTELSLAALVVELKCIEDANGRSRDAQPSDGKGLDIDVLTYGDLQGNHNGIELPRSDIQHYAHVLMPLAEIAPHDCLPGTNMTFAALWREFDSAGLTLTAVAGF